MPYRSAAVSVIAILIALFSARARAQEIETQSSSSLSHCTSYAWRSTEKLPIYDPMVAPDNPEFKELSVRIDRQVRETVEQRLRRRGWTTRPESPCEIGYSLVQELDMTSANFDGRSSVPRTTGEVGEGFTGTLLDSNLERRGTLTVELYTSGQDRWIWRGMASHTLGKVKDIPKNAGKLAEKLIDRIPKS